MLWLVHLIEANIALEPPRSPAAARPLDVPLRTALSHGAVAVVVLDTLTGVPLGLASTPGTDPFEEHPIGGLLDPIVLVAALSGGVVTPETTLGEFGERGIAPEGLFLWLPADIGDVLASNGEQKVIDRLHDS